MLQESSHLFDRLDPLDTARPQDALYTVDSRPRVGLDQQDWSVPVGCLPEDGPRWSDPAGDDSSAA